MQASKPKPRFHVGDWVQIPFGTAPLRGEVIEDRGAIGVGGRRLFRVSIPIPPAEPMLAEFPEDEIEPAPENSGSQAS
jgi:hypothetical protein